MRLFLTLAVIVGKLASLLSKIVGGRGSSLPGVIARRIYPHTLRDLANQVNKGVIMVTGTNGKTTTNNMIANIMKVEGHRIIFNEEGANLITGVTTSFIRSASITGTVNIDYALLEVDEASFPKVVREVKPQVVVVTNFFRDQLDRYGELDKTVGVVADALRELKDVTLVLNADDPLVAQLANNTGHRAVYYGVGFQQDIKRTVVQVRESRFCPFCGGELRYDYYHYSQLGSYKCNNCEFHRPQCSIEADRVVLMDGGISAEVCYNGGCSTLSLNIAGYYNLYNALAAMTVGRLMGTSLTTIEKGLRMYKPAIGRMERFRYQDKPVLLNLVKNPTGYNEGLATLLSLPGSKDVFMALNDNDADGRDISWLWDVDFEILVSHIEVIHNFVCSGIRAEEMALRLKYAGIHTDKIMVIGDLEQAISTTLQGNAETAYLFATYTALWPAQSILCRLAVKEDNYADSLPSVS